MLLLGLIVAAVGLLDAFEFEHGWKGANITLETMGQMPIGPGTDFGWDQIRGAVNQVVQVPGTSKVFATAINYGLVFTSDFEAVLPSWQRVDGVSTAAAFVDIDRTNPKVVVVATGHVSSYSRIATDYRNGIYRSEDSGLTFQLMGAPYRFSSVVSMWGGKAVGATVSSSRNSLPGFFFQEISDDGGPLGEFTRVFDGSCFDTAITNEYTFVLCSTAILRFPSTQQDITDAGNWVEVFHIPVTSIPFEVRFSDFAKGRGALEVQHTPGHPAVLIAVFNNDNGPGYFISTEDLTDTEFMERCSFWPGFIKQTPGEVTDAPLHGQGDSHLGFAVDPLKPYTVYVGGSYYQVTASIGKGDIRYSGYYTYVYNNNYWGSLHPDVRQLVWYDDNSGGPPSLIVACDNNLYQGVGLDSIPTMQWLPKAGNMVSLEAHSGSFDYDSGLMLMCFQDNGCANFLSPTIAYGGEMGDGGGGVLLTSQSGKVWAFASAQMLEGLMQYSVIPVPSEPFHIFPAVPGGFFVTNWVRAEGGAFAIATAGSHFLFLHENVTDPTNPYALTVTDYSSSLQGQSFSTRCALVKDQFTSFWVADDNSIYKGSLEDLTAPLVEYKIFDFAAGIKAFAVDPSSTRFFVANGIGQLVIWSEDNDGDSDVEILPCPSLLRSSCATILTALWVPIPNEGDAIVVGTTQGVFVYFVNAAGLLGNWCGAGVCYWAQLTYPGLGDSFAQPVYTLQLEQNTLVLFAMGSTMWKLDNAVEAIRALRALQIVSTSRRSLGRTKYANQVTIAFNQAVSLHMQEATINLVYPDSLNASNYYLHGLHVEIPEESFTLSDDNMRLIVDIPDVQSDRFFFLSAPVGSIVSAADPTVYLAYGEVKNVQSNALSSVKAATGTNILVLASGYVSSEAPLLDPQRAVAPTAVMLEKGLAPSELLISWTPQPLNDCKFRSWAITFYDAEGVEFQLDVNVNGNLYDFEAYKGFTVTKLSYAVSYSAIVRVTCLADTTGSPLSSVSESVRPTAPLPTVYYVQYAGEATATTLAYHFGLGSLSGCTLDHWDFEINNSTGNEVHSVVPKGCEPGEIKLIPTFSTKFGCTARELTPATTYRWARARVVCTDGARSDWVTNDYSWGQEATRAVPMTRGASCSGLCQASECVDGMCTCAKASPCCAPQQACSNEAVNGCLAMFDSYCADVFFDAQCVAEAQDRCQMQC